MLNIIKVYCLLCILFSYASHHKESDTAKKPLVVFVRGDHEYSREATMPLLAAELQKNYGMQVKVFKLSPDQNTEENIPGMEALKEADLAVFFLRWRRLPAGQVKHIDDYLKSGKQLVGFRTTTWATPSALRSGQFSGGDYQDHENDSHTGRSNMEGSKRGEDGPGGCGCQICNTYT